MLLLLLANYPQSTITTAVRTRLLTHANGRVEFELFPTIVFPQYECLRLKLAEQSAHLRYYIVCVRARATVDRACVCAV